MAKKKRTKTERPEALLTIRDVANYLQVAERTVYLWAQAGSIPSFKLGNVWRFKLVDVDAWIEEQRQKTPRKATR